MSAPQNHVENRDARSADAGSRTMTVSPAPEAQAGPSTLPHAIGTLRLRGGPLRRSKVTWTDETVDNEGLGKKKSKICCIYHKPKAYDESSSESESDEDPPKKKYPKGAGHALRDRNRQNVEDVSSESDGGTGNGKARPSRNPHRHDHECDATPPSPAKANKYDQKSGPKDT